MSTDVPQFTRFTFPGFGLPLNFIPRAKDDNGPATGEGRKLFRNALNDKDLKDGRVQLPLTTLREFTMLRLMNEITDKPDWHKKITDEAIVAKWRAEALAAAPEKDITESMVDWCIAELQYKAKTFEKTWSVSIYNGDVVKSDHAVPAALKEALKAAVAPLEQVPAREKDWHPGSDEKVLDLVHPSLFPLIYGRSRILPDSLVGLDDCIQRSGEGVTIPVAPLKEATIEASYRYYREDEESKAPFSRRFQWLPCEVDLSGGEGTAKITSYINNLHPERHCELYSVLEQLIACAIPLWNRTLTPLLDDTELRIYYYKCEYDPDPEDWLEEECPQQGESESFDEFYDRREEWYEEIRRVVQPGPGVFVPPADDDVEKEEAEKEEAEKQEAQNERKEDKIGEKEEVKKVDLWKQYKKRGIQVIVKLANIHLTPEKQAYEGGSWHVEGKLNEHICASAIYYYDSHNITPSHLAFRQQSDTDTLEIHYEQDHRDWLPAVFGCDTHGRGIQDVGTVETREGRLLTWPNILQHQVQPFRLADPTKPGHRKIVALFLVDPGIRVVSTANVPCQQKDWWSEKVVAAGGETPNKWSGVNAIANLPLELRNHIFEDVDGFPIGLEEAKEVRLQLMEERKKFVVENGKAFAQHQFSLCEH
ncbi:hypothetical protein D9615_005044 [Tricholomella constricta]|uniref:Uncharacterized protein n=1 Tax=Tricholomella constricta TaxID=117010 RepID=A0A8H5M758_9AGAR|nr:hypothetical protein D9615_005044 [Tricholomella constricta]